ncbi:MAG: putative zinc-binding peptidase [Rhizobiaceae bacterium]|nr:putative zinc-binding peptidase [Rhizobiaceae bacterium]
MKLFSCTSCSQVVFFENVVCERCNHALGFEPQSMEMVALTSSDGIWEAAGSNGGSGGERWKYCANYDHGVCNWLVPGSASDTFCLACRHNLVVPDLSQPANAGLWQRMERAKRRLFYTLLALGLPLSTRNEMAEGLGFAFLTDDAGSDQHVMTGHDEGLITIALIEADDAEREKRRTAMGEPYRTLLGHFRHEVGHWYWDRLVRDGGITGTSRAVFGNDEVDYETSLQRHYANGPKPNWQDEYVSSYAGAHAWEDFAETWAHYFHIVDTLETGNAWGLSIQPHRDMSGFLSADLSLDVFANGTTIEQIASAWLPLSLSLNSFNRSLGQQDIYPFVLSEKVLRKLGFIHDLVHGRIGSSRVAMGQMPVAAA